VTYELIYDILKLQFLLKRVLSHEAKKTHLKQPRSPEKKYDKAVKNVEQNSKRKYQNTQKKLSKKNIIMPIIIIVQVAKPTICLRKQNEI